MEDFLFVATSATARAAKGGAFKYGKRLPLVVETDHKQVGVAELAPKELNYQWSTAVHDLRARGYAVRRLEQHQWCLEVQQRLEERQLRAHVVLSDNAAPNCINGGKVAELWITSERAGCDAQLLYKYVSGPDVNRLSDDRDARLLCDIIVEKMS